ncbi:MAG: RidA family protein [Anaerolinea sp.]|nr:RidA family protein [Anaerolinea sp.]
MKEYPIPQGVSPARGYSHVVAVTGGTTVYVAGQIALGPDGKIVGSDIAAQARQVFLNVRAALTAAGATFSDVVKMTTYVVGLDDAKLAAIREARKGFPPSAGPPASTLVGVSRLAMEGLLIEVEVVAVID